MGFKIKSGVNLSYEEQAYIWAYSRLYKRLCAAERAKIRALCQKSAGAYAEALLDYVTTDDTATRICLRHNISRATLYRCVQKYYMGFWGR